MIELVLPSSVYKDSFIRAVQEVKKFGGVSLSSSELEFVNYDLDELENNFENYVVRPALHHMIGENLPEGHVPSTKYWIVKDGMFVGRISLRHYLNEFLTKYIGHIGYVVLPAHRQQGIATEALKQVLAKASEIGMESALVTCKAENEISKHILESAVQKFGGYQDISEDWDGVRMLRFWIKTK